MGIESAPTVPIREGKMAEAWTKVSEKGQERQQLPLEMLYATLVNGIGAP